MGDFGYYIILGASTLAFFTTANGGLLAASRYPLALSRDRLMPQALSAVSKKKQTPVLSVVVTGVIIYLSLIFELETLVKVASTVILTSYVLTNVAVLVLRQSGMTNYKPSFRSPLVSLAADIQHRPLQLLHRGPGTRGYRDFSGSIDRRFHLLLFLRPEAQEPGIRPAAPDEESDRRKAH
jgi:hypothetical protein